MNPIGTINESCTMIGNIDGMRYYFCIFTLFYLHKILLDRKFFTASGLAYSNNCRRTEKIEKNRK